jgi:exosortase/archaeosortase family protein
MRYCLLLAAYLAGFAVLFNLGQEAWSRLWLQPVCQAATAMLQALGIAARLDTSSVGQGVCTISMARTSLRVIHECTGIFTLFIYLAATLAYPAAVRARIWGMALGIGGFLLFSTARLGILGVVGQAAPGWLALIHLGLMVVANLGFALFLWLFWVGKVTRNDR